MLKPPTPTSKRHQKHFNQILNIKMKNQKYQSDPKICQFNITKDNWAKIIIEHQECCQDTLKSAEDIKIVKLIQQSSEIMQFLENNILVDLLEAAKTKEQLLQAVSTNEQLESKLQKMCSI